MYVCTCIKREGERERGRDVSPPRPHRAARAEPRPPHTVCIIINTNDIHIDNNILLIINILIIINMILLLLLIIIIIIRGSHSTI